MIRRLIKGLVAALILAAGYLAYRQVSRLPGLVLIVALALVAALAVRIIWGTSRLPSHRARHTRMRLRLRLHPGKGHASRLHLWLFWSAFASFRESARTRPALGMWARFRHPVAHAVYVGKAHLMARLWLPVQEHVLAFSLPRSGKSGWLGTAILHYPGPVLSTTTKADLFGLTSGIRSYRGPIHVFNPQRIGGAESTFRWSPIDGCQDPATAIRRADAFSSSASTKGTEGADFWSDKCSDYLRAMFCAAAVGGGDLRNVLQWINGINTRQALDILRAAGFANWAATLAERDGPAQKTAATVKMVMTRALAFMDDPALCASVLPRKGEGFGIEDYLRQSGTLYMVAQSAGEKSPLAALYACLTTEVHYQARLMGSRQKGGRLDPPLLMALDEVTQICPVPVPSWLADSGGVGIQLITVCHGMAQLEDRWGKTGAQTILDTSGCKVALPGITATGTLDMLSSLCGKAHYRIRGDEKYSEQLVIPPDVIRQLPAKRALVIRGSYAPVIAKLPMVWKDDAVKQAKRAGVLVARLSPAKPALATSQLKVPVMAPAGGGPEIETEPGGGLEALEVTEVSEAEAAELVRQRAAAGAGVITPWGSQ